MINLRIGQKIKVEIRRLGINGEGIGYYQKRLIFVPYALPDEEALVEITENQRNFSRAKLVTLFRQSHFRVEPQDKVFAELSSSHIMHLAYPQQLMFKRDLLAQALEKYKSLGYQQYELRPTIGMENPYHYRNKLTYQLRRLVSGHVIAGLYRENTHHLVELRDCLVQEKLTQKIVNQTCRLIEKLDLPVYDERQIGGLRTVMVRRSQLTGDVQMILVSSIPLDLEKLIVKLTAEFTEIKGIAFNLHPKKSSEIYGDETELIWGQPTITEGVLDYDFELSPRAFYQLNPSQANILYAEVVRALHPQRTDRVVDAYCGAGTIGFALAKSVKSVHGMDTVPEAIADAKQNAERLGLSNCHYEVGRAERVMPAWYKSGHRPTALIVDPPRTGLDDALLETLADYAPEKMVYVSCNVSTLAKDLTVLAQLYKVDYIQSVDMFPHTARTEAVVKLKRKERV